MNQAEWCDEIDHVLGAVPAQLHSRGLEVTTCADGLSDALAALMEELDRLDEVEKLDDEIPVRMAGRLSDELRQVPVGVGRRRGGAGPEAQRSRASKRNWISPVKVSLVAVAAAVVLLAILVPVLGLGRASAPGRLAAAAPAWRLVSAVSSPFRSLPEGGQPDLQCVSDDVCYSPGYASSSSDFYRTSDGGQSWQQTAPIPLPLSGGQFSFDCSSADTCAVLSPSGAGAGGQLAQIGITTDGGADWHVSSIPTPSGISGAGADQFVCTDGLHCVVSVTGMSTPGTNATEGAQSNRVGTFLSTDDGGETWTQASSVPAGPAGAVWTMNCTDSGSCLAISAMGDGPPAVGQNPHWIVSLTSDDWGNTWMASPPAVYNDAAILYTSCPDANHCMLVMIGGPGGYQIAITADAGMTWKVSNPPAGWLNMATAVNCATGQDCWIATSDYDARNPAGAYSNPVIEVTHDGGQSWSSLALPASKPPISDVLTLSCPSSGAGCMGIGNLQDHFVLPPRNSNGTPARLSGPLVISNLPPADQS
jgi:photosystem II stability/assembly factor-like uncharacterized protein